MILPSSSQKGSNVKNGTGSRSHKNTRERSYLGSWSRWKKSDIVLDLSHARAKTVDLDWHSKITTKTVLYGQNISFAVVLARIWSRLPANLGKSGRRRRVCAATFLDAYAILQRSNLFSGLNLLQRRRSRGGRGGQNPLTFQSGGGHSPPTLAALCHALKCCCISRLIYA